jgi:hypothetical protein
MNKHELAVTSWTHDLCESFSLSPNLLDVRQILQKNTCLKTHINLAQACSFLHSSLQCIDCHLPEIPWTFRLESKYWEGISFYVSGFGGNDKPNFQVFIGKDGLN